jgi:hypothetical protein
MTLKELVAIADGHRTNIKPFDAKWAIHEQALKLGIPLKEIEDAPTWADVAKLIKEHTETIHSP